MFMSNLSSKYVNVFLNTLQDPRGMSYNIPLISYILLRTTDITTTSNSEHNNTIINMNTISTFLNMFVETTAEDFPQIVYHIPRFNLYHHGNICHLNTCLLMLSSLFDVVKLLVSLDNNVNNNVNVLRTILTSAYSPVDMYPVELLRLIRILNIDINAIIPAEETMTQLIHILSPVVPLSMLLNWDFAHSCLPDPADKDASLSDVINKYEPYYLLVNGQDFSVANNVECNNQFIPLYTNGTHVYKLASIIVYTGGHFINVFMHNDDCIIKDDICHRYAQSPINIASISQRIQITQICYVKVK